MPVPEMSVEYVVAVVILALPLLGAYMFLIFRSLRIGQKWNIVETFEDEHKRLSTPAGHGFAYLTALVAFIAFVPISILTLFLVGQMVAIVSNTSIRWMLFQGPDNALRNWLELCAFAATAIVAGVAWFALRFAADQARHARKQADEAEHSRAAQVYLQITGRFMSPSMSTSRVLVANLYKQSDKATSQFATASEFFHDQLEGLYNSEYMSQRLAYLQHIEILFFFEDVGVLVKRNYVQIDDIRLLFRGPIITISEIFAHHIKMRREVGTDALFENFTDLCELMKKP